MPFRNKINREEISLLAAFSLLLSYAEFFLPHPLPFLKFGFSNAVILFALYMNFPSVMILCIIKSIASSFISGTLISPFFLISLTQSIISGFLMYALNFFNEKIFKKKFISVYGISLAGSAMSAFVQIFLCSFYLGKGTFEFLGIMLIFSIFSGIITAYISQKIQIHDINQNEKISDEKKAKKSDAVKIIFIIIFSAVIFLTNRIQVLAVFFAISFLIQIISKRKIYFLPHLFMWIFVIITGAFVPSGEIIFRLGKFSVTKGALILSFAKALKLSSSMMLSQAAAKIPVTGKNIIAKTIQKYQILVRDFEFSKSGWKNFFESLKKDGK